MGSVVFEIKFIEFRDLSARGGFKEVLFFRPAFGDDFIKPIKYHLEIFDKIRCDVSYSTIVNGTRKRGGGRMTWIREKF